MLGLTFYYHVEITLMTPSFHHEGRGVLKVSYPQPYLLKYLYHDRKVTGNVFVRQGFRVWLFLRIWYLILVLSRQSGLFAFYFIDIWLLLTRKLLKQMVLVVKSKSSLRTFYGRHHDLNNQGYVQFIIITTRSFPQICFNNGVLQD